MFNIFIKDRLCLDWPSRFCQSNPVYPEPRCSVTVMMVGVLMLWFHMSNALLVTFSVVKELRELPLFYAVSQANVPKDVVLPTARYQFIYFRLGCIVWLWEIGGRLSGCGTKTTLQPLVFAVISVLLTLIDTQVLKLSDLWADAWVKTAGCTVRIVCTGTALFFFCVRWLL